MKTYHFTEDYINPNHSQSELMLLWLLLVAILVGLPYFSEKIEKYLDKEKKD
tara:strand:+ start:300 stop:455 length:156 start_codon:yes stop_codon:yes gene_type:complete